MSIAKKDELYKNQTAIEINKKSRLRSDFVSTNNLPSPFETPPDTEEEAVILATNEIDNSDFAYSKDRYLNAVPAGGDVALESYNWFRQRFIRIDDATIANGSPTVNSLAGKFKAAYTYPMDFAFLGGKADGSALTGTLTRVTDNQATLSVNAEAAIADGILWFGETLAETSANALKTTAHTLFAANEAANTIIPRWDNTNGWAELGSNNLDAFDIACPLALNVARAGLRFFISVIVARRTGAATNANSLKLLAGIWDSTPAQSRFIEASNIVLSGAVVGTAGATTYNYKIIARTDTGLEIESQVLSITTGNAALTPSNYIRLSWTNVKGILDFEIQRSSGGVFKRVFTIQNGSTSYNDTGYTEGVIPAFSSTGTRRALGYAEKSFTLAAENDWQLVRLAVQIPPTYNSGATTGKQWLRLGVSGTQTDVRAILIDRVLLSLSDGGWNISNRDRALSASGVPSVNPVASNQGETGIYQCLAEWVPVIVGSVDGKIKSKQRISVCGGGQFADDGARGMTRFRGMRRETVEGYFSVVLSNKILIDCTDTERFVTSRADKNGTMLKHLAEGDEVLTKFIYTNDEGEVISERVEAAVIQSIIPNGDLTEVFTPSFRHAKTFVAGEDLLQRENVLCGAILHNRKYNDFELY